MKKQAGLTLMELMVAIALIGVLSSMAVPNMIGWRNNMQFSSAVRTVKIAIEDTRMAAIKSNMPARMIFTDGGDSFDIVKWDFSTNNFASPVTVKLPPGTEIASSNFNSDTLQFNGSGMLNTSFGLGGTLKIMKENHTSCRAIVLNRFGSSKIVDCP